MGKLENYQKDFILLCEAGFIAVNQMDEDAAKKLFSASALLKPENYLPDVGMGYMHLGKLELKQAVGAFEKALKKEPDNEMAKAFLGICIALTPNEEAKGEKLLQESAKKTQDPEVKKLAASAIEFVEKFIKKSPSPAELKNTKR